MAEIRYRGEDHTYWLGRRQAVSVTRVLEHAGIVDPSHYSRHDGEDFLERGRAVHEATAKYDEKRFLETSRRPRITADQVFDRLRGSLPERWRGFMDAWKLFLDESGFVPEMVERRVFCPDPLYAGTLDRMGRFPGARVPAIVDLKNHNTGSVQKNAVRHQLVAYGHALDPKKLFERYGVALNPDGRYRLTTFPLSTYMEDRDRFLAAAAQMHDSRDFMRAFGV
jgi:hypothetical protein